MDRHAATTQHRADSGKARLKEAAESGSKPGQITGDKNRTA